MLRAALEATPVPGSVDPGLGGLVGYAWLAYFSALMVAPAVVPVVLVATAGMAPMPALDVTVAGVALGYAVGIGALLRPS